MKGRLCCGFKGAAGTDIRQAMFCPLAQHAQAARMWAGQCEGWYDAWQSSQATDKAGARIKQRIGCNWRLSGLWILSDLLHWHCRCSSVAAQVAARSM